MRSLGKVTHIEVSREDTVSVTCSGSVTVIAMENHPTTWEVVDNHGDVLEDNISAQPLEVLIAWAIDEHMYVHGYGRHAGKRYWQLPENLRDEVVRMALKAVRA